MHAQCSISILLSAILLNPFDRVQSWRKGNVQKQLQKKDIDDAIKLIDRINSVQGTVRAPYKKVPMK